MKASAVVPGEKAVSIAFLRGMGELRRHVRAHVNGIWRRYLWRASRLAMLERVDNAVASSGMEPVTDRVSLLG